MVEESESDSGSEEQYEPPKRSNRRSRQQNNQMQQRNQQGPMNQMGGGMPGTMGNVANQAMQQQQQQPQGGGGGGKSDTLRLRLDLNLDIEITLKAKIHGDLELALLYVLTSFLFYCSYPLSFLATRLCGAMHGVGGCKPTSKWMEKPPASLISLSFSRVILPQGKSQNRTTLCSQTPVFLPSPHCNHICSVSKERPGTQRKNRSTVGRQLKGEKQRDIKNPPHDFRIPDSVCLCGGQGQDQKPTKNHVSILLSSFPGWLVSVLAAQCCPERLASYFPHHHVLLLRTRK